MHMVLETVFGLAFDPLTGYLWQTENGPDAYDEINVVKPGFNSGWIKVMGPLSRNEITTTITTASGTNNPPQLVNFPGAHYADPVFSLEKSCSSHIHRIHKITGDG